MNFNDIDLRLRYPHLFRDQDDPHRAPPHRLEAARAIETRTPRRTQWGLAFFSLFRKAAQSPDAEVTPMRLCRRIHPK